MDPSHLRLSPVDDELYTKFRQTFPDMKVDVLVEDEMKSASDKVVRVKELVFRRIVYGNCLTLNALNRTTPHTLQFRTARSMQHQLFLISDILKEVGIALSHYVIVKTDI